MEMILTVIETAFILGVAIFYSSAYTRLAKSEDISDLLLSLRMQLFLSAGGVVYFFIYLIPAIEQPTFTIVAPLLVLAAIVFGLIIPQTLKTYNRYKQMRQKQN